MRRLLFLAAALLLVPAAAADATPTPTTRHGRVTIAFDPHHRVGESLGAAAPLPGGGFVGAGTKGRHKHLTLVSVRPDGTVDPAFGDGGKAIAPQGVMWADDVLRAADGTLTALGHAPQHGDQGLPVLVRAAASGTFDTTYGDGGVAAVPGLVMNGCRACGSIAATADGGTLVAGFAGAIDAPRFGIAKVRADGWPDTAFGSDGLATPIAGYGSASSVVVQPGGRIVALGSSGPPADDPPQQHAVLVGLRADGTLDPTFGGGDGRIDIAGANGYQLAQDAAGRLYVVTAPQGTTPQDSTLRRYLPDGTPDPSFGTGGATDLGTAISGRPFPDATGVTVVSTTPVDAVTQVRVDAAGTVGAIQETPLHFGGGIVSRRGVTTLRRGLFAGAPLAREADGTVVYGGDADVSFDDGGAAVKDATQWAFALVRPDGGLAPTADSPRLRAHVHARRESLGRVRRHHGVKVTLRPRRRGLARVSVHSHGRTIAREMVGLYGVHRITTRIRLTHAGRRMVRRHRRVRLHVTLRVNDLVGHRAGDHDRITLRR